MLIAFRQRVNMRTVVIVSPHFPPSSLAGVHRARHLARHLPSHGWKPVIVRVDPNLYLENNDYDLSSLLPEDLVQEYCSAIPVELTRRFGVTDIGLLGYFTLRRTAEKAAKKHKANVIMLTGSPFYPLTASRYLKRVTGLPVLLDFQDPWVNSVGGTLPFFSKGRMAHRLACILEPKALVGADFITSVSDRQNDELAARQLWFDRNRMAGIPIGGDPLDFERLRTAPPIKAKHRLEPDCINFSYVGTMLPRSGPLVESILAAVACLKESDPELATRIRFNFVGTSNQVSDSAPARVMPLAQGAGVAEMVRETPGRVPFLEALSLLANSDGLIMFGSDEPHYTASKIYPNLMAKRPFVSLFHEASSAHRILSESGGGRSFAFSELAELSGLVPEIANAIGAIARDPRQIPESDPAAYADFTADSVARRYAEIFDILAGEAENDTLDIDR